METAEFSAVVDGTADGAVIHCEGDLNVRADAALEAAYTEAASLGASADHARFRASRLHQQHRDRVDRSDAHDGPGRRADGPGERPD